MYQPDSLNLEALDPLLDRTALDGRTQLIPVLLQAQQLYGHLPEAVMARISERLHVPLAEIQSVTDFYSMLYDQPMGTTIIRVCTSPRCQQAGGEDVLRVLCDYLQIRPGETTPDGRYTIEEVPCLCLCDMAPAALVGEKPVGWIDPTAAEEILNFPQPLPLGHVGGEPRWKTARCGTMTPTDLEAYRESGGFQGLRKTLLDFTPAQVITEIKYSGLVGRGGAAFPTGLKWQYTAHASDPVRFLVCNGDESEPGTFKDRVLMEGDPFLVLEGMIIAGYAIGAGRGYIYVRGEYPRAQDILNTAISIARQSGYLGNDILGSGFDFEIELRSGAGAYVCGEETALFESIEGKRGYPRLKPPYPTTEGLFGKPTVINNVETLAAAAWIMSNGADLYRSVGTEKSPGSKLFCLSGDVMQPGVYESPFGISLRELLEIAGGPIGELQTVLLGGAAGAFIRPDQLSLSMSFEGLQEHGLSLGSGVVMAINHQHDLRQTLLSLARFFAHESCGKCYPCQLGTQRQLEIMEKVAEGSATERDMDALRDVGYTMTNASICGLGSTAATAILSALNLWPELFTQHGGDLRGI